MFGPNIKVNVPVCLAPMVGLSHVCLRRMLRSYLPTPMNTLWPTEMLNSHRVPKESFSRTPELMRSPEENQLIPQILANEKQAIYATNARLKEWGASGVDINMGCPVAKALRHNYGVALMGDPDYAFQVVKWTSESTDLPVSVKLRVGEQRDSDKLLFFVEGLIAAGAKWICIHPRTSSEKRRGSADWSQIALLKREFSIPIIGNGDVQTVEDVHQMKQETQCDLVMVGRALIARPWMIAAAATADRGRSLGLPQTAFEEGAEFGRSLLKLIAFMQIHFEPGLGLRKFRFHVKVGASWLEFGHALEKSMAKVSTYEAASEAVELFFRQPQRMTQRTQLRY